MQDTFLFSELLADRKLSAAFDMVDHPILLQRLTGEFGLCGAVHWCFRSYLSRRSSQVSVKDLFCHLKKAPLKYGVRQGSVIGPQVFHYTHFIGHTVRQHAIQYHMLMMCSYVCILIQLFQGTQLVLYLLDLPSMLRSCRNMISNKLMMNRSKSEFFIPSSLYYYKHLQRLTIYPDKVQISPS